MSYEKFLTSNEVFERDATFPDGTTDKVYFRKCAHVDFERWRMAESSDDPGKVERGKQLFIASVLVSADGKRALTDEQSVGLTSEGVNILFPLALEVAGLAKKKGSPGNGSGEAAPITSSDTSPSNLE